MRPQAAALKELLDKPELQVMPGCGDAMGARLIEEAGFRIGFISGSSIAAMRLAMPDMDLLTFPEMADAVETCIAAAPKVLWLADGDTGYGNALAVQKTIRAYARRGAAAVLIEDKAWPRPLGHAGARRHLACRQAFHARQCRVAAARHPPRGLSAGDPCRHGSCGPRGARRASGRAETADGEPGGTGDRDPRRRLSRRGCALAGSELARSASS